MLLIALAFLVATPPIAAEEIQGRPRVVDGDSLAFGDAKVRLAGIDAPESRQICQDRAGTAYACGKAAAAALIGVIGRAEVRCAGDAFDRYQRLIATCRVGALDIGAWLVRQGWALAFRRYSDAYVGDEAEARAAGRGLWAGEFEPPWDWRQRH